MALIKTPTQKEAAELYKGFSTLTVGPGTDPDAYASAAYAARKTKEIYIGSLFEGAYSGYDHDSSPLVLALSHVSLYNVVLGININYLNTKLRLAVLKYVLESNKNRIRDGLPILINYQALKRAIPPVAGATRMYKLQLIRVKDTYPLVEWEEAAKKPSSWENHYKKFV